MINCAGCSSAVYTFAYTLALRTNWFACTIHDTKCWRLKKWRWRDVYVSNDVVCLLVGRIEHDAHTNAHTLAHNTIYESFKFSCSGTSSKVLVEAAHCEGSLWNATQLMIRAGSAKENTSATNPYKNVWFCINPGLVSPFFLGSSAILSPFSSGCNGSSTREL